MADPDEDATSWGAVYPSPIFFLTAGENAKILFMERKFYTTKWKVLSLRWWISSGVEARKWIHAASTHRIPSRVRSSLLHPPL